MLRALSRDPTVASTITADDTASLLNTVRSACDAPPLVLAVRTRVFAVWISHLIMFSGCYVILCLLTLAYSGLLLHTVQKIIPFSSLIPHT